MDIAEFKQHYSTLDDEQIRRLALYEAGDLRPVAQEALAAEIERRDLSSHLLEAVEIHTRGVSDEEREEIVLWFRQQPCPSCGGTDKLLNAVKTETVISYLVVTTTETKVVIACPECLEGDASRAGAAGLPGPGSIISAIKAEVSKELALQRAKQSPPTKELLKFVDDNLVPLYLTKRHGQIDI